MARKFSMNPLRILHALALLRALAIALQVAVVLVVDFVFGWPLPVAPMLAVPAALVGWNLATLWRLRRWPQAAPAEVVVHLAVDVAALTLLLWLSGGPGNPFVSLYLLPIAVAAASLPALYAWATTALCTLAYSLMLVVYMDIAAIPGGSFFHWHVVGMWANFIVGALLLMVLLSVLAGSLRRRDQALAEARERALRDERIVATGTLAAGTAHELNTPLSTMAVLSDELRAAPGLSAGMRADLDLLAQQIGLCKERVHAMLAAADPDRNGPLPTMPLRAFLDEVFAHWRLVRPEVSAQFAYAQAWVNPAVQPEPTLGQALANLLNNAADASAANGDNRIAVHSACDAEILTVTIDDHGRGLTREQRDIAGRGFWTTKVDGHGLGLALSNASVARLGGELRLHPRQNGGLRTEVRLPLAALRAGGRQAA